MKNYLIIALLLISFLFTKGCSENSSTILAKEELLKNEILELKLELDLTKQQLAEKEKEISELTKAESKEVSKYMDLFNEPLIQNAGEGPVYSPQSILDGGYSIDNALKSIEKISSFLWSFAELTEKSKKFLSKEELKKIGNTDGETQTLLFANLPLSVKGVLLDQNYIIKKQDLGLAIKLYEAGEINLNTLENKFIAYQNYKKEYEDFISNTFYGD